MAFSAGRTLHAQEPAHRALLVLACVVLEGKIVVFR